MQLRKALRGSDLGVRFRRQHSMGPYVLDFFAPAARLVVEVDGAAHDVAAIAARDEVRDAWLRAQGLRVLRFHAPDVLDPRRRDDVLATIFAALTPEG